MKLKLSKIEPACSVRTNCFVEKSNALTNLAKGTPPKKEVSKLNGWFVFAHNTILNFQGPLHQGSGEAVQQKLSGTRLDIALIYRGFSFSFHFQPTRYFYLIHIHRIIFCELKKGMFNRFFFLLIFKQHVISIV